MEIPVIMETKIDFSEDYYYYYLKIVIVLFPYTLDIRGALVTIMGISRCKLHRVQ